MRTIQIASELFATYPDAQRFMDRYNSNGKTCLVTRCNEGFLVDVFETLYH